MLNAIEKVGVLKARILLFTHGFFFFFFFVGLS